MCQEMSDAQVVSITGSSRGIGRFLVEHFIRKGFVVEGCSRGRTDFCAEGYTHHTVDVSKEEQVKSFFASIKRRHGRLDVAINNAGIGSMNHVLLTPAVTASRIIETNLKGTFLACREGAKLMQKRRWGRIVNFSTVAVPLLLEGEAMYAASKCAIVTFTKILAREVADFGITCNVVGPAPVETDLIRHVPPRKINSLINRLTIKQMGRFEDIAHVIDFFICPESGTITGQVVYLGGA